MKQHKFAYTAAMMVALGCGGRDQATTTSSNVNPNDLPACCRAAFDGAASGEKKIVAAADYPITLPNGKTFSLLGLTDQNSNTITPHYYAEKLEGKPLAIYIGFPACNVFCPPATSAIKAAMDKRPAGEFQIILITIDVSNTPADMKEWLSRNGLAENGAIGLCGDEKLLQVIHSRLFSIDPQGNHTPNLGFVNAQREFIGGAQTIRPDPYRQGVFLPTPHIVSGFIRENFPSEPAATKDLTL